MRRTSLWEIRGALPRQTFLSGVAATFLAVLAVWCILSYGKLVDPVFMPTPVQVLRKFLQLAQTRPFWNDVGISVFRVTAGFLLAAILGIPLGILAGAFPIFESVIVPSSEFIRYMPASAFIPLIMVWAGVGEEAKILVIFIGSFFQLVLMVADNTRAVSNDLLQVSYTLGASRRQVIRKVLIPALLPDLVNTLRLIIGWAWTYLVVAELVASNSGLGFAIMKAQRFLNTDMIFVGILVIGLLGLLTDRIFAFTHRRCFPWMDRGGAN